MQHTKTSKETDPNNDAILGWDADVHSAQDYYAFGMTMPGRNYSAPNKEGYRYGFNGMEKDDDWSGKGNSYDFGARILDVRTGRFLSVDPRACDLPSLTTYAIAGNSPIILIDKDGEFPWGTGLVGAGVSIAIGYLSAKIKNEKYTWEDAGVDAAIGFMVGSGAALVAPLIGLGTATTTGAAVTKGMALGSMSGVTANALDQSYDILTRKKEDFEYYSLGVSGVIGLVTGGATSGASARLSKLMLKVKDKKFADFTNGELQRYINLQSKKIRKGLKIQYGKTGGKAAKQEYNELIEQVTKQHSNVKAGELDAINYTVVKGSKNTLEIVITVGANKIADETNKE